MRVLTFTTLFPNREFPRHGLFVLQRTAELARRCEVEVIAPIPLAPPLPLVARARRLSRVPREETIRGLRVAHPRYWSLPGTWAAFKPASIHRASRPAVRRILARGPVDLVDAHYAHPDAAAAARVARDHGLPLVVTLRGSDIHRDLGRSALRERIRATLESAAAIVAVAQPLADAVLRLGVPEAKVSVIDNGVDGRAFAPGKSAPARRELGISEEGPWILSVGSLVPVKGQDLLLDAMASLAGSARLLLVGEGPELGRLRMRAARLGLADRVHFAGGVPHERLPLYYRAADLFCLPSRNEGCPNVVLEALASGCPVVAAAVGQVPNLVEEGRSGLLVPPEDASALAGALGRMLAHPTDRAAARASVEGRTWATVADRVADLFEEVLGRAGRTSTRRTPACG
ncbi:MAG: glycosyltransferase [Planctomycetaceae bacterium]